MISDFHDATAVNGEIVLATRDYGGRGPDVLFIPGGGQTLADCDLLAPYLTVHHRVVAMDVRGHGFSGDGPFSWDAALDDVDAVTEALSLDNPAVIGHSLGGMIAALHGARHPNAPGVVNIDGHGGGKPEQYVGVPRDVVLARMAELKDLQAALGSQPQVIPEAGFEAMVGHYQAMFGLDSEFTRQALARAYVSVEGGWRPRLAPKMSIDIVEQVQALDFGALYRDCKASLLVYNAVKSSPPRPGEPPWMAEHLDAYRRGLSLELATLSEQLPNMSWIAIDATHALPYEKPQLISEQIAAFLAGRTR